MNHYLLSVYEVEGQVAGAPSTPEQVRAFIGRATALRRWTAPRRSRSGALHGPEATTVVRGGTGLDKVTADGPFLEAKERIGGLYIINAANLDEATNHDIEVRPFRATGRVQAGPGH